MSNSRLLLQIKLSALKAGASAATVLLTCVAILPVRSLIDRAFDGRWGAINWKISAGIILTISGLWFVVLFSSNLLELRASDLRQQTPSPTFPARLFIRLIFRLCWVVCRPFLGTAEGPRTGLDAMVEPLVRFAGFP